MYYTILVLAVLAVAVAAVEDECRKLDHPGTMYCCKSPQLEPQDGGRELFPDCLKLNKRPSSCDIEMCIAQKKGLLNEDRTMNKKALANLLQKDFKSSPDFIVKAKTACLDGDVSMYLPQEACETHKINFCVHVNLVKSCTKWSEEGECKAVKELAEKCRD